MRAGPVGIALIATAALALAGGCSAGGERPTVADSSPQVTRPAAETSGAAATHGGARDTVGVTRHCGLLDRSGTAGTSRFLARVELSVPDDVSGHVRVKAAWDQEGSKPVVQRSRLSVDGDGPLRVVYRLRASQAEVDAYPGGERACHVAVAVSVH